MYIKCREGTPTLTYIQFTINKKINKNIATKIHKSLKVALQEKLAVLLRQII